MLRLLYHRDIVFRFRTTWHRLRYCWIYRREWPLPWLFFKQAMHDLFRSYAK